MGLPSLMVYVFRTENAGANGSRGDFLLAEPLATAPTRANVTITADDKKEQYKLLWVQLSPLKTPIK